MSAIPFRPMPKNIPNTFILELCNTGNTLDLYGDRLTSQGYEVVSTNNYTDGLRLAHEYRPALVVVYDDPATNIDAVRWLELQHSDHDAKLVMTPLLILADPNRSAYLRFEELPDRVVVVQRRADTLNQLTRTVKHLLHVWNLE